MLRSHPCTGRSASALYTVINGTAAHAYDVAMTAVEPTGGGAARTMECASAERLTVALTQELAASLNCNCAQPHCPADLTQSTVPVFAEGRRTRPPDVTSVRVMVADAGPATAEAYDGDFHSLF